MNTSAVILAAGNSSRMGQPKMLLSYRGKTLLQHVTDEVLAASISPVVVVTGAESNAVQDSLLTGSVYFVQNEHWQEGMAASIRAGVDTITAAGPALDAVVVLVCDQPFVSADLLQRMMLLKQQTGKGLIACAYNDTTGTPVLFDKRYFAHLRQLEGQQGAKKLLKQFAEDVATVDFPQGATDIDTPGDYERLLKSE
ncbi:MAG: nucleotidyltransferase family protein [Chitinophagaceae bacterium]